MRLLRSRLTYANVIATLALFLALTGGVVWAAGKIGTHRLKKNAVSTAKIKRNAVTTVKLHGNAVTTPKLKALAKNPRVSITIDDNTFPHKVLLLRGSARLEAVNGVAPEYALAAERYFGPEQGRAWVAQMGAMVDQMVRIVVTPDWVGLLDFQTRFPSALPL